MSRFAPATKMQAKGRVALIGPAGGGKTMTALKWARALAGPTGRIAVIDTEHGTAAKYADPDGEPWQQFDHAVLTVFAPLEYVAAIRDADAEGYDVTVIDSLSHAWSGKGGALAQVDQYAVQNRGDSFSAWRTVTPQHNELVEAMLGSKAHLIVTMRSKMEYAMRQDEKTGRHVVDKLGMAPVQRDGLEYEFDLIVDLDTDNYARVGKTRCTAMSKQVFHEADAEHFQPFIDWLDAGADPIEAASQLRDQALEVWDDPYKLRAVLDRATSYGLHTVTVPGVADVLAGEAKPLVEILTARGRSLMQQRNAPQQPAQRAPEASPAQQDADRREHAEEQQAQAAEARQDAAEAAADAAGAPAQSEAGQ